MKASGLDDRLDALLVALPDSLVSQAPAVHFAEFPVSRDPYSVLHDLRERVGPIARRDASGTFAGVALPNRIRIGPETPWFLVLGHEAYMSIVRDSEHFGVGGGYGPALEGAAGKVVTFMDGDEHRRYRKLLNQAFGRGPVNALIADLLDPISSYLVDRAVRRMKAGQPVEIMRDLAMPMSYKVMACMLGVPDEEFGRLIHLGTAFFDADTDPAAAAEAAKALGQFFRSELEIRRRDPRDDILTWLATAELEDGQRLTDEDIVAHARFLLPAGIETTSRQLSMMVLTMLTHLDQYAAISDDASLADAAVEEVFRWAPINASGSAPRWAVQPTNVCGVDIPKGALIQSAPGIINRDPARWERPDDFDIRRPVLPNVTLAFGAHHCLGAHIAKAEMILLLQKLAQRAPGLRLETPLADIEVLGINIRCPVAPVRLAA
jgi:cytochrome P450